MWKMYTCNYNKRGQLVVYNYDTMETKRLSGIDAFRFLADNEATPTNLSDLMEGYMIDLDMVRLD